MGAWLLAAIHLLALPIGFAALFARGQAMKRAPFDAAARDALLAADNVWGVAALLWYGSGLTRLFAGSEKPTSWYWDSDTFWLKVGLIAVAAALETPPMVAFIRWRHALKQGAPIDVRRLPVYRRVNDAELAVTLAIAVVAAGMARGVGYRAAVLGADLECDASRVFQARCLRCHGGAPAQAGLDLGGDARRVLVGVPSPLYPGAVRVVPGDPEASLLHRKLSGTQGLLGAAMPPDGLLPDAERAAVEAWIRAGAPACGESASPGVLTGP